MQFVIKSFVLARYYIRSWSKNKLDIPITQIIELIIIIIFRYVERYPIVAIRTSVYVSKINVGRRNNIRRCASFLVIFGLSSQYI